MQPVYLSLPVAPLLHVFVETFGRSQRLIVATSIGNLAHWRSDSNQFACRVEVRPM